MGGYLSTLRFRAAERRALRLPAVKLCKRLCYEGWEHLHGATLVFFAPVGSPRVARRILALFLEDRQGADADLDAAEKALAEGLAGVWMVAEPERRGRWAVRFLPPVAAAPGDTADALFQRFLDALDDWTRGRDA